jgi:post-segregation antitoxin (ccd killing protein)
VFLNNNPDINVSGLLQVAVDREIERRKPRTDKN